MKSQTNEAIEMVWGLAASITFVSALFTGGNVIATIVPPISAGAVSIALIATSRPRRTKEDDLKQLKERLENLEAIASGNESFELRLRAIDKPRIDD